MLSISLVEWGEVLDADGVTGQAEGASLSLHGGYGVDGFVA